MPQVPRSKNLVQSEISPNVRVSTDAPIEAFGGGASLDKLNQAQQQGLSIVDEIVQKEQKKADDIEVTRAFTKTLEIKNRILLDEETGFKTVKGRQSAEMMDSYKGRFDEDIYEIEKSLTNDRQKAAYKQQLEGVYRELDGQMQGHVFSEVEKYDEQETQASLNNVIDDAIKNYQMPGKVRQSLDIQKSIIQQHGENNGLPPETIKQRLMAASSKTHYSVVSQMLNGGDDRMAKEYFEQSKEELDGETTLKLERLLEESSFIGTSQRETDRILEQGLSQAEALKEARKLEGKERDEVVRRVKNRYAETEQVKNQQSRERYAQAFELIEQGTDPDTIPREQWNELEPENKKALLSFHDKMKSGENIQTDINEYYNLKLMAANPETQDKFRRLNVLEYADKLSTADRKEIINLQAGLLKNDPETRGVIDGYRSDAQVVNDSLASVGIKAAKDPETANLFRRKVDELVQDYKTRNGSKTIPNGELQAIVDNLLVEGSVPGTGVFGIFKSSKRRFELKEGETIEVDVDDIPENEISKIRDSLLKNNLPVTDEKMVELYRRKIAGPRT